MSPWIFNVYINAVLKEVKMGMGKMGVRFLDEGKSGDYRASCIQMIWFYVASRRKT